MPGQIKAFRSELFPALEELACESSWIASGLIHQIARAGKTSGRFGLAGRFAARLDKQECEGLSSLPEGDKDRIHELTKKEEEERHRAIRGWQASRRGAGIAESTTRDRTRNAVDLA